MVKVTELPLTGNMKKKFELYLKKNPLDEISLGDFGKWEDADRCAVCGHNLIWSFKHRITNIGICCGSNILALKEVNGDYDKLNFERVLKLQKNTIQKRKIEWSKKQKAQELEIKYNDEFKYCTEVIDLTVSDKFFQEHNITSQDDDNRNEQHSDKPFFYAGIQNYKGDAMVKVYQCESWLHWLSDGVVNDFYIDNLRKLMQYWNPKELVEDAKERVLKAQEKADQDAKELKDNREYFEKVCKLKEINLGMYDIKFVKSLANFFSEKQFYTVKQKEAIDKLYHRYRKQLDNQRGDSNA